MPEHRTEREVAGPWSLATSRTFWEGFGPAALRYQPVNGTLRTVFLVERDWSTAVVTVRQEDTTAHLTVTGEGDLAAATEQTARFLALDIDATDWPAVGTRDQVIAAAQAKLPGLRPCGFHSPYEAATWAVLSQRLRVPQAAQLRTALIDRHGHEGAFPAPALLRTLELNLPGRKAEYLRTVADAALDGTLDGTRLRELDPAAAVAQVQQVKGLGPFAAELVVLRGANHPDAVPRHEEQLLDEITVQYGPDATLDQVSPAWQPFRTWASVHLRAIRALHSTKRAGLVREAG
ncbi:DNA-3-methyladenine glycosylase family protein [Paractinoplanes durhamensis]|uniref:DNA-3-methyladenine glycosylase family protein n=1 Tax=Paractinoplanes durhamensis TaxID=113563 RepID=UPI003625E807